MDLAFEALMVFLLQGPAASPGTLDRILFREGKTAQSPSLMGPKTTETIQGLWMFVLFLYCCNKLLQTHWLKTTQILSMVLEVGSLKWISLG